jgi:hypothetical protein
MSWTKWTTLPGEVIQVGNVNQAEITDKPPTIVKIEIIWLNIAMRYTALSQLREIIRYYAYRVYNNFEGLAR